METASLNAVALSLNKRSSPQVKEDPIVLATKVAARLHVIRCVPVGHIRAAVALMTSKSLGKEEKEREASFQRSSNIGFCRVDQVFPQRF